MRFKSILTTFALAGVLGLGVMAGLSAGNEKVEEARAEDVITYYLTGSWTGQTWATSGPNIYQFEYHNENEVKILGHTFTGNNTFKAIKYKNGVFDSWMGNIYGYGDGNDQISARSGINAYAYSNNAGIHYNDDSNEFNIYYNFSTNHFYIDYAYKITDGSNESWMERSGSGEEYSKTLSFSGNKTISITAFNRSSETINPQSKPSNNLTSDKKVKIDGEHTIYWNSLDKSTWLSGYEPVGMEDADLQNFCDNLLNLDCSATDFTSCGWDGLDAEERKAFNDAIVTTGYDVSYSTFENVVNEAATRYVRLLGNAGAVPLDGASPSARIIFENGIISDANNSSIGLIVIISAIALTAVGGYFFLRRKED